MWSLFRQNQTHLQQVACGLPLLSFVLRVLAGGPVHNTVLLGHSLGGWIAHGSQQLLEFSSEGARALIELDSNHLQPYSLSIVPGLSSEPIFRLPRRLSFSSPW